MNQYEILEVWLTQHTSPEVSRTVLDSINLLQENDPSGTYDNLIMNIYNLLDDNSSNDDLEVMMAWLVESYMDTLPQYGIILEENVPISSLRTLNGILRAILTIPDYEDVIRIYELFTLGNSNREIFSTVINTISPELDESDVLNVTRQVLDGFITNAISTIESKYQLAKMQLNSQSLDLDIETNKIFARIGARLQQKTTLVNQFPNFISILRGQYIYHADRHEQYSVTEAMAEISDHLQLIFDGNNIRVSFTFADVVEYHASWIYARWALLKLDNIDSDIDIDLSFLEQSLESDIAQDTPSQLKYLTAVKAAIKEFMQNG